jgi:hypothetical protein
MAISVRSLNFFLLRKIPVARFAGIRIHKISNDSIEIYVRQSRLNQNPFHSIYFGVLVMAGELATGVPLFVEIKRKKLNMSMLVIKNQSEFYKKATGKIRFCFRSVEKIREHLTKAVQTGEAVIFDLETEGTDEKGNVVGKFVYTWSVKLRRGEKKKNN